jgi:peptidoglycan hydrolase-like protein with peptidoglycan-binding domain
MAFTAFRNTLYRTGAHGTALALCLSLTMPAYAGTPNGTAFDALPDAKPGECYARVMIAAQYETRYKDVTIDEGGERIDVSQPRFASQAERYVMRDAGVRYVVHQPVYKTVFERVLVRPAYERLMVNEAQYRTVTEQVVVAPARTAWKPGKSLADWSGVKATKNTQGEVYCLVEIPAQTKTVSKRVLVRPQSVHTVMAPPVYRTLTRQVLVNQGGVEEVPLPAQYGQYTTQQLVQQATQHRSSLAPRTRRIAYSVMVRPERYGWIRVLCKTNATPAAISSVQSQLQQLGYYQGQLDGQLGLSTENAVREYQQAVGIPHGGYLSLDTIEALREGRTAPAPAHAQTQAYAHASANASSSTNIAATLSGPQSHAVMPSRQDEISATPIEEYARPALILAPRQKRLSWSGKS